MLRRISQFEKNSCSDYFPCILSFKPTLGKCKDRDPRSKKWNDRAVDQPDVIDSDLPIKIALNQKTNDMGQIILIYIANADGDVRHPTRRMIVILDTRTHTGNFLPECFMKLH